MKSPLLIFAIMTALFSTKSWGMTLSIEEFAKQAAHELSQISRFPEEDLKGAVYFQEGNSTLGDTHVNEHSRVIYRVESLVITIQGQKFELAYVREEDGRTHPMLIEFDPAEAKFIFYASSPVLFKYDPKMPINELTPFQEGLRKIPGVTRVVLRSALKLISVNTDSVPAALELIHLNLGQTGVELVGIFPEVYSYNFLFANAINLTALGETEIDTNIYRIGCEAILRGAKGRGRPSESADKILK